ncbi:IQ and AAA domain-containing protein 1-like [Epargyreus clarus]|uniref:IQ and AAA domain-containing protein 1-like n=1 Tax=Epargyreus clarus TaxID=520877 RepID=UPI003C2D286F
MRLKLFHVINLVTLCSVVQSKLTLKQVVILNRHSLRTPLSKNLNQVSPKVWPKWTDKPGYLTAKGSRLAGYMGTYFAAWLKKEGVLPTKCPTEDDLYVYSNTMERTLSSAQSFIEKGFPNCKIEVHHININIPDPLFTPIIHNTSAAFREDALDEMQDVLNTVHLNQAYDAISTILDYKNSRFCKVDKKCDLVRDKNRKNITPGHKPGLAGPLKICNEVIDAFLMQNYEGFPTKDVAWGQLADASAWQTVMTLNRAYHNVTYNTSLVAKDVSEPLVKYISNIFLKDDNKPKVTLLVGHDANLYTVFRTLGVKAYTLQKQNEITPVGSAVVFQKWRDDEAKKAYLKIDYVYQSTDQLRHSTILSLETPPMVKTLELKKCKIDKNGLCSWEDFQKFLTNLLYELRNELVHLIVNDYIYVDDALITLRKTPFDIEIIIPYHFPLESRPDTMEHLLQTMWSDAYRRKTCPKKVEPESHSEGGLFGDDSEAQLRQRVKESSVEVIQEESVHTIIPEEFIQSNIIQKHERFRKVMELKRLHAKEVKRDIKLGLLPDPFRERPLFEDENNKMYERKRNIRQKINEVYLKEMEREKTRLIVYKKDNQIDDITDHVRAWFREWFYGYGFFPTYPYEVEGGTIMVIRGAYPTIQEKVIEDEKYLAATKGKTKEMLNAEKKQAKADALLKAQAAKEQEKKEAEALFKLRCSPLSDPGYQIQTSGVTGQVIEALQKYRASWSIYDTLPPDQSADTIYGFMKPFLTEDLMSHMHAECRLYVDELMKLDLKLLIKAHQQMYKAVGWKYPKLRPRPKPRVPPVPKPLKIKDDLLQGLEEVFDLGIITKPKSKLKEIYGDYNYAAYDFNLRDPDAKFPSPGYADVRRRLKLSCVFGSGIEPGATRNKAVMILGPVRNGKSFLVDAVAGEMNAVKIDITPEVFSAVVDKPLKVLPQVFIAARVFQPSVIYMRNIERVFCKKVQPQDKYLNATQLKTLLPKLVKQIVPEDKVIFIATCSDPFVAQAKPLVSMFSEIILVPRTDYASLRSFFYYKFQGIRSMPRDYCVQALAQVLQGYGFGAVIELYDKVMTADRIVRLNITPLSPAEFLQPLFEMEIESISLEDYQEYVNFFIQNSPLSKERAEFETINVYRAVVYKKLAKDKKK